MTQLHSALLLFTKGNTVQMKIRIEVQVVKDNDKYSARLKSNLDSSQENIKKVDSLEEISDRILEILEGADEKGLISK